ncbi:MAG: prolyl oligopeptidase family serine peptidase, partial [Myxococcota bacterium]|nr:prolyl oligopeptidase family serine peptidase [Myxococcota bacterium]
RVHEYGGGAYLAQAGRVFVVDDANGGLREIGDLQPPGGRALVRDSGSSRFADLALSPDERWLVAVEECEVEDATEPVNRLVVFDTRQGAALPRVLDATRDFVSSPTYSLDGNRLAYLGWAHPHMPWDETSLYVLSVGGDGPVAAPRCVAGGSGESLFQPTFGPDGRLYFVSDRSGWWNLYSLGDSDDEPRAVCEMAAEFGAPQWGLGMSRYAFIDAERILCAFERGGISKLGVLDVASGELRPLALPFSYFDSLRVDSGVACFLAASATSPLCIYAYEIADRRLHLIASSEGRDVEAPASQDANGISSPEAIEFHSEGGREAHAFFSPPRSAEFEGLSGELPPLLVKSHGGPTGVARPVFDPGVQFWTSRGFAVVDVNYGGSTSFGRAYRERLDGNWGIVDVEDCVGAARYLASIGLVDAERMLITGGSAGGYTTLCALTFHDVFRAGASHYGIGDIEALARDTHKFESRYTDRLVAPYPEARERYRERSPVHFADQLSCPVIFFQGLDDLVVPPEQARAMVAALAARKVPHAHVEFEGEGHGFRRAENIQTALEGELYFYSKVLGFGSDVDPAGIRIVE